MAAPERPFLTLPHHMRSRPNPILVSITMLALLAPTGAWAEDDAPVPPPLESIATPDFAPPEKRDDFDWVRLVSGEWLKGSIEGMRDDTLRFDSDELDLLNLDFEDVTGVVTTREHTVVFKDWTVATGTIALRGGIVRMRIGDEVRTFPRSDVEALIAGTPHEWNYWSGEVSAGATFQSGNTNQTDGSGTFELAREDAFTRGKLKYNGAYGKIGGDENTNNHRAQLKLDWFVSPRFYLIPLWLEGYKDEPQNIEWRLTPAKGAGYTLVDLPRFTWDVEAGVGYQYILYSEASAGDTRTDTQAAAIFATAWESDLTSDIELDGEYRMQLGLGNIRNTSHHFLTVLSIDLIYDFDLDLTFVWDRTENPLQEEDGRRPDRNDFRTTVGLGWDF
jgi:hypothetical protein